MSKSTYNQVQGRLRRLRYPSASRTLRLRAEEVYISWLAGNRTNCYAWIGNSATRMLALLHAAAQIDGDRAVVTFVESFGINRGF